MTAHRSNYALIEFSEHLGPEPDLLDVPWAAYVGDESTVHEFEIDAAPTDGYVTIQALDVGEFGHELLVNGEALSGFDLPPHDGWQSWMDVVTGTELVEGTNTIGFRRDESSDDSFVVGTVRVNWREPDGEPTAEE